MILDRKGKKVVPGDHFKYTRYDQYGKGSEVYRLNRVIKETKFVANHYHSKYPDEVCLMFKVNATISKIGNKDWSSYFRKEAHFLTLIAPANKMIKEVEKVEYAEVVEWLI